MNNRLNELQWKDDAASVISTTDSIATSIHTTKSATSKSRKKSNVPKRLSQWSRHKKKNKNRSTPKSEARTILMGHFYDQIEALNQRMATIPAATQKIQDTKEQVLLPGMSSAIEKRMDDQVCFLVNQTSKEALAIRTKLGYLQDETKALSEDASTTPKKKTKLDKSDIRIRIMLSSAVANQLMENLGAYQAAQQNYKIETREKLLRQIRMVQPAMTNDDIDAMIRHGEEDRDSLYQRTVLCNTGTSSAYVHHSIGSTHRNVVNKHSAILEIEQNIAVMHQLFLDLALLTRHQGKQLNRIDFQVQEAADYIEEGNENLCGANKEANKLRKKKRYLSLLATGVTAVVVIIIIL